MAPPVGPAEADELLRSSSASHVLDVAGEGASEWGNSAMATNLVAMASNLTCFLISGRIPDAGQVRGGIESRPQLMFLKTSQHLSAGS